MALCFGWLIVRSIYIVVSDWHVPNLQHPSLGRFVRSSVEEVALLALAVYVLHRQGRTMVDLGFSSTTAAGAISVMPRVSDLFPAVYLTFGAIAARYVFWYGFVIVTWLSGIHLHSQAMNVGFAHVARSDILIRSAAALVVVVNAIYEESLVRAYLMTEVVYFTRKPWLALFVSVIVQSSYHLYQGVLPAFSDLALFFVFAFFYMRTGRIWPVIFAHMLLDVIAMFMS